MENNQYISIIVYRWAARLVVRIQKNVDSLFFYFVLLLLRELARTWKGAER